MTLQKRLKEARVVAEVISAPMLATVVSAALGTGIVLKNKEEIYHMGRLFYDYVKNHNSIMWDSVVSAFESSVAFNTLTKQVTIGREFGGILKGFFDNTFGVADKKYGSGKVINIGNKNGYPDLTGSMPSWGSLSYEELQTVPGVNIGSMSDGSKVNFSNLYSIEKISSNNFKLYNNQGQLIHNYKSRYSSYIYNTFCIYYYNGQYYAMMTYTYSGSNNIDGGALWSSALDLLTLGTDVSLSYNTGVYNPGNVWGDTEEVLKDVPIYVPGDLSDILNGNPGDVVGDKAPSWAGNGSVSIPQVNNPSISVDGSTSFPAEDNTNGSTDIEYNKTVWSNGDLITADKLNNIEDALEMFYKVSQKKSKEIDSATARMVATMPATMLAIVSTLAVGTGIALSGYDDIYDIGRMFYEHIHSTNKMTWDVVKTTFESACVVGDMIKVDKNILDICKDFFDSKFNYTSSVPSSVTSFNGIPVLTNVGTSVSAFEKNYHLALPITVGTCIGNFDVVRLSDNGLNYELGINATYSIPVSSQDVRIFIESPSTGSRVRCFVKENSKWKYYGNFLFSYYYKSVLNSTVSIPYQGGYDWGKVDDKTNGGLNDLPLPIPGNLGDLIGKNPSDVWDKNYENGLIGNGDITVPDVSNPSIGLGGSTSFPTGDNTSEDGTPDAESGYNKTIWKDNDLITEAKLNKIENAIAVLNPSYEKTNWNNGDVIIADLLNKIENALEAL